jgi:effector-binding domain-containing protein
MEIKEIKPVYVFFRQIETTLKEISMYVGNMPALVAEEAVKKGYKIIGPQIWNYTGVDGNPDTKFKIDIAFPVGASNEIKDPSTKLLDGYKGACYILKGPWSELTKAYSILIAEMKEKGLEPSQSCREIYHLCDFIDQQNCITEIQMGIQ